MRGYYLFIYLLLFLNISCTDQSLLDTASIQDEIEESLYISKNTPSESNLIDNTVLYVGDSLNLYSLSSKDKSEYSAIAVKWSLSGSMGNLNVQAGGKNAVFSASAIGEGSISIESGSLSKVVSIEVRAALNTAPVANDLSVSNFYRGIEETISLNYSDTDSDLATSCSSSNLINLVVTEACSCDGSGLCTIKLKALSAGAASFDYWVNANSLDSNTAKVNITVNPIGASSEDQWVKVPKNAGGYGLDAFYVMKYEAKAWNDTDSNGNIGSGEVNSSGTSVVLADSMPISIPENQGWRRISPVNASAECQSLGTNYDLISNTEWMAIAKNIETQDANWSSGTVGTGCLNTGNGSNTLCGYNSASDPDSGVSRDPKAKHVLSNGSEIYDLSGNLVEWVDWDISTAGFQITPLTCYSNWQNISSSVCPSFVASDIVPNDPSLDSSHGIGQMVVRKASNNGALARGGSYVNTSATIGLYSFNNYPSSNYVDNDIGFRCVFRP